MRSGANSPVGCLAAILVLQHHIAGKVRTRNRNAFTTGSGMAACCAEDSPWREGIVYVTEQGIACGTGGGCFAPDAPVTTRQWATMVYHALQVKGAQSAPVQDVVRQGYEQHWLSMTALTAPDLPVCRGVLYQSAFRAFKIQIYSSELYPDSGVLPDTENCMRAAKELGQTARWAVWRLSWCAAPHSRKSTYPKQECIYHGQRYGCKAAAPPDD